MLNFTLAALVQIEVGLRLGKAGLQKQRTRLVQKRVKPTQDPPDTREAAAAEAAADAARRREEAEACVHYLLRMAADPDGPFHSLAAGPATWCGWCMQPWRGCYPRQPLTATRRLQVTPKRATGVPCLPQNRACLAVPACFTVPAFFAGPACLAVPAFFTVPASLAVPAFFTVSACLAVPVCFTVPLCPHGSPRDTHTGEIPGKFESKAV